MLAYLLVRMVVVSGCRCLGAFWVSISVCLRSFVLVCALAVGLAATVLMVYMWQGRCGAPGVRKMWDSGSWHGKFVNLLSPPSVLAITCGSPCTAASELRVFSKSGFSTKPGHREDVEGEIARPPEGTCGPRSLRAFASRRYALFSIVSADVSGLLSR